MVLINAERLDFDHKLDLSKLSAIADTVNKNDQKQCLKHLEIGSVRSDVWNMLLKNLDRIYERDQHQIVSHLLISFLLKPILLSKSFEGGSEN